MAAPVAAAAKRGRDSDAPPLAPLARWDYLLAGARTAGDDALRAWKDEQAADMLESEGWEAGENEDVYDTDKYQSEFTDGFIAFITEAVPDLTGAELALVHADADLAWCMAEFDRHGDTQPLRIHLTDPFHSVDDFKKTDLHSVFVHQVRRLRRAPSAWADLLRYAADSTYPYRYAREGERNSASYNSAFLDLLRGVTTPEDERASFDASQVQRHMHVTHRVPAPVANLVGQFASSAITARSPMPMRLQVQHKLELLTRSVASLGPEAAAAELRAILADVEEALPIRNKKKPRPAPAAPAATPDSDDDDEDKPIAPRQARK